MSKIIKDSGNRRKFDSGAVRDRAEGKGLPTLISPIFAQKFIEYSNQCRNIPFSPDYTHYLHCALQHTYILLGGIRNSKMEYAIATDIMYAMQVQYNINNYSIRIYPIFFQKLAHQLEEGAKKYGQRNWEQGMPLEEYLNSLLRHLLQWYNGDEDEPHDAAAAFNIMCYCHTREMIKRNKLPKELSYLPDFKNHSGSKLYDIDGKEIHIDDIPDNINAKVRKETSKCLNIAAKAHEKFGGLLA